MTVRFAFYGRVSTEDNQDPEASRNWQMARALALIDKHGHVVTEFFDIGQSRSLPWKRRPQASHLLEALKDPNRGFSAVVIGEPQRAFYGSQYGLTYPVLQHWGVDLWVPEVGGVIDPESEAHDMVMSVFGGMSKGERSRIKIRVRAAMRSQAEIEGRFLGGRPPYGYRLVDVGPHPNPAKAAEGRQLRNLEPHPETAPVVQRIFAEYVAGTGYFAIAEGLTRDGIKSPSAHDPRRNAHRCGVAWAKSAVRAILVNPRYTGRQVWNKQRKDEVLLDVDDVGLGHVTKMRWNERDSWVWSTHVTHEALVTVETFERAQQIIAAGGRGRVRELTRVPHAYALRGLVFCGVCQRRMQGQWNHGHARYRCRFPEEYALANKVAHPLNVYVAEREILPPLDEWLMRAFAPHRLTDSVEAMYDAQPADRSETDRADVRRVLAECDRKLGRYREALDAGADPVLVAGWIAEVQARRAEASARLALADEPTGRLSREQIRELVEAISGIRDVLAQADPADKGEVYRQLGLRLTYQPALRVVRAEANPLAVGQGFVSEGGHAC